MRSLIASVGAIILAVAFFCEPTFAQQQEHHPDQGSASTGSAAPTPDNGAQGQPPGCPMMGKSEGDGGMMHSGMMGRGGMGKMHGRHGGHHSRSPSVVINIYPGGMGMMGQGGMGQMGGMMHGGGMGMMGQGSMGQMGGMMMGRGQSPTPDRQITVDEVRNHMTSMIERMGGEVVLGEVKEIDQDLIDAKLNDASGSMFGRMIVNRHTGAMMRVQ